MRKALLYFLMVIFVGVLARASSSCVQVFTDLETSHRIPLAEADGQLIYKWVAEDLAQNSLGGFEKFALEEYGSRSNVDLLSPEDKLSRKNLARDKAAQLLIKKLKKLGSGYEQLIVDPGLMFWLDNFVVFMKKHSGLNPWDARKLFAYQPSMMTKVYRGVALTVDELNEVKENGFTASLLSPYYRFKSNRLGSLGQRIRVRMRMHESGETISSPFLSVTSYPALAAAMAIESVTFGKSPIVFEIDISKVDLISSPPGNEFWEPSTLYKYHHLLMHSDEFGDQVVPIDEKIEKFIFARIQPNQIHLINTLKNANHKLIKSD